ncbi:unnamed protein product [Psylliodes chrysocephalus]|uniref:Pacifastin domain-containing protein n=1 Tax=Psylliodes chrysocephalus TaxID=3402493 RepID=A0A9P0D5S7_9CUCU|nr:unnamed protein product [Psylliodes chrysocephala]
MDTHFVFVFALIVLCSSLNLSQASLCKANSKFIVDCNTCQCSSNGKEYSCTDHKCDPSEFQNKYDVKIRKDGFKVLVSKSNDEFNFDDDDFILTRGARKPRVPEGYPYINDEMYTPEGPKKLEDHKEDSEENNFIDIDGAENMDEEEIKGNTIDDEDNGEANDLPLERWARFIPTNRDPPIVPLVPL